MSTQARIGPPFLAQQQDGAGIGCVEFVGERRRIGALAVEQVRFMRPALSRRGAAIGRVHHPGERFEVGAGRRVMTGPVMAIAAGIHLYLDVAGFKVAASASSTPERRFSDRGMPTIL